MDTSCNEPMVTRPDGLDVKFGNMSKLASEDEASSLSEAAHELKLETLG